MASLIQPLAISGARDSLGAVVAGGRVYLTVPGAVNTAVTAYSDADQSSAVSLDSGGYLLDSGGRVNLYVANPCSVRIDNSAGVTVGTFTYGGLTADNLVEVTTPGWTGINSSGSSVSGARTYLDTVLGSLYTSLGGLDGKYRGTYGINDTTVKSEVEQFGLTPQRFGAKGDGVTDDTNAFLLLAAAQTASQLPVYLPRANYKISSVISWTTPLLIEGTGASRAINITTPSSVISTTSTTQNGFNISGTGSCVLRDFSIIPTVNSSGTGINHGASDSFFASNVLVNGNTLQFATAAAINAPGSPMSCIVACNFNGSTNALNIANSTLTAFGCKLTGNIVGFLAVAPLITGTSSSQSLTTSTTADVATGGTTVVPAMLSGQVIQFHRVRMSSSGAATATVTPPSFVTQEILVIELNNVSNAGGTCGFTLSAPFKSTTASPINVSASQRIVITYAWNATDAVWIETQRTASFAGSP
jgi:hypothetical protein